MTVSWEGASFALTALVVVLQAINLYTTATLKVWALQKFITKADFLDTLQLWGKKHGD